MKKILKYITVLILFMSIFSGCSDTVDNKITFQNFASNKIFINFRATLIQVDPGKSAVITEIPKGTFSYETTYEIPVGTISSRTEGAVSGEIVMNAGVKVLIVYSSTFTEGVYTLSASFSSSEDLAGGGDTDPIGP
ncbi:MAG: hypothetical protein A2W30_00090 [Ignavibacteria bacterium RBG_16_36_9]|nr:MAG: hypothetical protein A2W30_00090 [Ignavibacteria bacterium RBG_16_36_9]